MELALITVASVVLGTGGLVALLKYRPDNTRTLVEAANAFATAQAETATTFVATANTLVQPLNNQLVEVRERIAVLEREVLLCRDAERACLEREQILSVELQELRTQIGGRREAD